jgi:hypothetical protein
MDKKKVYPYNGILFSKKKEQTDKCYDMGGPKKIVVRNQIQETTYCMILFV